MIEAQTYTSAYRMQGDDRTAGHMPVLGEKASADAAHFKGLVDRASDASAVKDKEKSGEDSFGFFDFIKMVIDIVNPLQHLPVISTIYRHMTGDDINPVARVVGGALFGGPIGAAASVANVAIEGATGKDIGDNLIAMITQEHEDGAGGTMLAQAPLRAEDIVWDAPPADIAAAPGPEDENVRLAMLRPRGKEIPSPRGPAPTKPPSYRTGLTGNGPDVRPAPELESGDVPGAAHVALRGTMNVKPALHSQKAPAGEMAENRAVPPELIAHRMMAALDKYAALKTNHMN